MYHSDYILWQDGLRLRRRNGGKIERIKYSEVFALVGIGLAFYQTLRALKSSAIQSFDPPREIVGRFSSNPPMPWTVAFEPETGAFSISGSSPGPVTSPDYLVQEAINEYLGGRVMAVFRTVGHDTPSNIDFLKHGFDPSEIDLSEDQFDELLTDIEGRRLWDQRKAERKDEGLLTLSPWGFRYVADEEDLISIIGDPDLVVVFEPAILTED